VPLPQACLRQRFADDAAACDDAPQYDVAMTIDLDAARVTGSEVITYTNAEQISLSSLYLRLLPNTRGYGGAITLSNVRIDGRTVSPTLELDGAAAQIGLLPPLPPGAVTTLALDFAVDVPTTGGTGHNLFTYLNGVMALPTIFPIVGVYDDDGWDIESVPEHGDEIHADIGIYHVDVTVPAEQTLIASGTCTQPTIETWQCEAAPMRDFTLVVGDNYERAARNVDGVVVNSYYYSQHEWGGNKALQVAVDSMEAFTELFGPYPYTELDVVATPNYLGGMEYSGLVVVEDGLYTGNGVEWLTAHEVAHQWWMVVVGNDQIDDPWLDEALTQYSTLLYYEQTYGKERADVILENEFQRTYDSLVWRGRDMPVGLHAEAYPSSLYWDVVYDKGALYFHNLRETVGDDAFFTILQTYFQRYRYEIATPEDFLAVVEDVTGDAQRDLYNEWIVGEDEGTGG
jgi:aminopeptidase N